MLVNQQEIDRVKSVLVPTWQSVIAISYHAKMDNKKVLYIIKRILRDIERCVEIENRRVDGHNPVYVVRPIKTVD